MLRYFPIENPHFEMTMNARAYSGPIIDIDPLFYSGDTTLRGEIVDGDPLYYHNCSADIVPMAEEAAELILTHMTLHYPQWFKTRENSYSNLLKLEQYDLSHNDFSIGDQGTLSPLDWIGRQVQEDLILMKIKDFGDPICAGGHLCFAAGWCLQDKIGQSFLRIHEDVPGFIDQIGMPSDLLVRRLKPGRPVMRYNWTLAESNTLNRAPKLRDMWLQKGLEVTPENAGARVFFRVEKQTLSKLPRTNGVLFTIRTHINPISEVVSDPVRLKLLRGAVKDMPAETVKYKNATLYYDALVSYLDSMS